MYDDRDGYLARVREICLALPEAQERVAHGRPTFRVARMFAVYGGSEKVRPGRHVRHDHALMVIPDPGERAALEEDPRFFTPAYLGPWGWVAVDLDREDVGWDEVGELVDASYRTVANARQLAALEARDG